jgi:succinate-semialdehyde dehydrogenase/glutarate-semialdehyde dehydrogenase
LEQEIPKLRTVAARAQIVKRAAALLRQNADEYAGYMTIEMGKLAAEPRGEIELSAAILDYYADRAEEFLKPQPLAEAPGSVMVIEPIGVLVAIEAWPRKSEDHVRAKLRTAAFEAL